MATAFLALLWQSGQAAAAQEPLSDGDGLVLLLFVKPGEHGWRFDYRFAGKRNMLSLGNYPDTTLAIARRKADAARRLLAEGFDPSQQRKAERKAQVEAHEDKKRAAQGLPPRGSFEEVAREWYAVRKDGWAKSYGDKIIARFETDVSRGSARYRWRTSLRRCCLK